MKATCWVVVALFLIVPSTASTDVAVETFDHEPAGWNLEDGAEVAGGVLRVLPGGAAYRAGVLDDLELSVRVRIEESSVGVITYRAGEQGRYTLFVTPNRAELIREAAQPSLLAESGVSITPGEWVDVSVEVVGSHHSITVGELTLRATDPDPHAAGEIALRAEGQDPVEFDDFGVAAVTTLESHIGSGWIRTGGPPGGLGYDVRMDPRDPDRMYVTDAFAGVFVSEDGGETWYPSNEGITTRAGPSGDGIPVFSLSIDPNDPDTLWVGTQSTRGIFRSSDGGRTWVEKDAGVVETEGITIRGFGVEPGNSQTVYAAGEISSWALTGEPTFGIEFDLTGGVIYKTTDGGETWNAVWRGDNLARYVWIDPSDTDTVYASTGIFDREAANSEPAARTPGGVGVLKSTDAGVTWDEANVGLENLYVDSLFLHPVNAEILLAGTGNNTYGDDAGVFLSVDGGANWSRTDSDGATAVEFATSNPDVAYAANVGFVRRSQDAGRTWEIVAGPGWGPSGVLAGFPIDIQVDPRDANRLFANNYGGGNFVSSDGGRTWQMASTGYTGAQVRDVVVGSAEAGRVYAAARSGLFTSADGGSEWVGMGNDQAARLEWTAIAVDPTDGNHLLVGTNWDGVLLESHDAGTSWSVVLPFLGERRGWRCLAYAPSDPAIVYGGTGAFYSAGTFAGELLAAGIWVSTDGGTTWEPANNAVSKDAQVVAIAVDQIDPRVVYAASTTHGILRSSDGGGQWAAVDGLPERRAALSVALDPADSGNVLVGFQEGGVYRSTDGGNTWVSASPGLAPEAMITDIVFDPSDSSTVYAADLLSGVYQSTDGGQTWSIVSEGLRTRAVNALAITADGEHLYAGTEGEGVFRLDISGTPPQAAISIAGPTDTTVRVATTTPVGETSAKPIEAPPYEPGSKSTTTYVLLAVLFLAGGAVAWAVRRRVH